MHRTQLMLETWQHDALKARAESAGISISELVRRIVTQHLVPEMPSDTALLAMEGIGEDDEATGRDHDRELYEPAKRRR